MNQRPLSSLGGTLAVLGVMVHKVDVRHQHLIPAIVLASKGCVTGENFNDVQWITKINSDRSIVYNS